MARERVEKNISFDKEKKLYYVNLDFGVVDGKQIKTRPLKHLQRRSKC